MHVSPFVGHKNPEVDTFVIFQIPSYNKVHFKKKKTDFPIKLLTCHFYIPKRFYI